MGKDSRNEDLAPPLAKQKFQELVAMAAETRFGPDAPEKPGFALVHWQCKPQ